MEIRCMIEDYLVLPTSCICQLKLVDCVTLHQLISQVHILLRFEVATLCKELLYTVFKYIGHSFSLFCRLCISNKNFAEDCVNIRVKIELLGVQSKIIFEPKTNGLNNHIYSEILSKLAILRTY